MHTTCGFLFQEFGDGALRAQRLQQLDFGVVQIHKHSGHAMVRLVLQMHIIQ